MPTLNWLTREADLAAAAKVPFRLLREEPELSFGTGENGLLVQGDNLDALKALLPFYAGRVKCIYIDPPYNTRSAFEHYDDNLEHAKWLGMIVPRLMLLREFLSEDGSIWVSIDDNEGHYLKVVMDEVFGRRNFVSSCTWQQRTTRENRKVFSEDCERIMIYCREPAKFGAQRNELDLSNNVRARYNNPDEDPRGPWQSVSVNAQGGHGTPSQFYDFTAPNGTVHTLPAGRCWLYTWPAMLEKIADNRIWFGSTGKNAPREKKFLSEAKAGLTPNTLWMASDVGTNDEAKKEIVKIFGATVFATPKPERLIQRILHIATNPGDLVLDSFLGSGTTAAVAHKMGRRWIGVEMGDHARTHCALRLKKVIEGEQGGISKDTGWQGGGGFRFLTLGPAIYDAEGRIAEGVGFADLARHVWFNETRTPLDDTPTTPVLGVFDPRPAAEVRPAEDEDPAAEPSPPPGPAASPRAVALLYNGILKDRTPQGGNVLTRATLALIREHLPAGFTGPLTVYAAANRLSLATLKAEGISFRQTPYELNAGGR